MQYRFIMPTSESKEHNGSICIICSVQFAKVRAQTDPDLIIAIRSVSAQTFGKLHVQIQQKFRNPLWIYNSNNLLPSSNSTLEINAINLQTAHL